MAGVRAVGEAAHIAVHRFPSVFVAHHGGGRIAARPIGQIGREPRFPEETVGACRIAVAIERRHIRLHAVVRNVRLAGFQRKTVIDCPDVLAPVIRQLLQVDEAFQPVFRIADSDATGNRRSGLVVPDRCCHKGAVSVSGRRGQRKIGVTLRKFRLPGNIRSDRDRTTGGSARFVVIPDQFFDTGLQIRPERCPHRQLGRGFIALAIALEYRPYGAADGPVARIATRHLERTPGRRHGGQVVVDRPVTLETDVFARRLPAVDEGHPFRGKPAAFLGFNRNGFRRNDQIVFDIGSFLDFPGRFLALDGRVAQGKRHRIDPVAHHVEIGHGVRAQIETVRHRKRHRAPVGQDDLAREFDIAGLCVRRQIAGHFGPGIRVAGEQDAPTVFQGIIVRGPAPIQCRQVGLNGIVGPYGG